MGRFKRRGGGRGLHRLGLGVRLGRSVDELGDLVFGESGQAAELASEVNRVLLFLAAEAAEAEQLVDRPLEVERLLAPLGVRVGEAPQPVRAHLHVGDLVGEHPVLAEVQDGIAGGITEVAHRVEHVDGQTFEGAVHAGEAQDGIGVARRFVEQHLLAELADLRAHVLAELAADLDVTGFVPALPSHVELQRERRFLAAVAGVEVPARAAGAFERLDLADEDAVHQPAGTVGSLFVLDAEAALPLVAVAGVARIEDDVFDLDALEPLVTSQLVNRQDPLHP